jgi:hypothetical protein
MESMTGRYFSAEMMGGALPLREVALASADAKDLIDEPKVSRLSQEVISARQKLDFELQGRGLVDRRFNSNQKLEIITLSDLHIGHVASDFVRMESLINHILYTPGAYAICLGDLIEGINPKFFGTNVIQTPIGQTEQILSLREILKKLSSANKLLAIVSDYPGHAGWSRDAFMNLYPLIVQGLNVPLVRNGGFLRLSAPDWKPVIFQLFHNPPRGNTRLNLTQGLYRLALEQKPSLIDFLKRMGSNGANNNSNLEEMDEDDLSKLVADFFASAHTHLAGSVVIPLINREIVMVQSGTVKDISYKLPRDIFPMTRMPGEESGLLANSIFLFNIIKNEKPNSITTYSAAQNAVVGTTLRFNDKVDSLKLGAEIRDLAEEYRRSKKLPIHAETHFVPRQSILEEDEESKNSEKVYNENGKLLAKPANQYRVVTHQVSTLDGVLIDYFGHTLYGNQGSEDKKFTALRKKDFSLLNDEDILIIIGQGLLHPDVAKSDDRKKTLTKMVSPGEMGQLKGKYLVVMRGGEDMAKEDWKGNVGDDPIWHGPVMPATFLSQELGLVPIVNNKALLHLIVGTGKKLCEYVWLLCDGLDLSGSNISPVNGLERMREQSDYQVDVVAGGDQAVAVVSSKSSPHSARGYVSLLGNGWYNRSSRRGKKNRVYKSPPGQCVIQTPPIFGVAEDGVTLPFSNLEMGKLFLAQLRVLTQALTTPYKKGAGEWTTLYDAVRTDTYRRL